jgi:hypothetical protein
MTNPYPWMGDPQDVKIVGFSKGSSKAVYSFTTNGFMSQMMSAPSTDDLFSPSDHEPKMDRDKSLSYILFRDAEDDKVPSNPRVRHAYGFNVPGIDEIALVRLYQSLQQHGIHPMLLDYWRTSASMLKNISETISVDVKLLLFLYYLDVDMKGKGSTSLSLAEN